MLQRLCFILCGWMLMSSCERGFEDLQEDPNASTQVNPAFLFSEALRQDHTDYSHGVLTEIWGLNTWMQVQSNLNGISSLGDEYFISGDALDNTWTLLYARVLGNVAEAIRINEENGGNAGNLAVYRIYRAYTFLRLTDLWGDIPYTEANSTSGIPNFKPSYDSQQSIYLDLLDEWSQAVQQLSSVSPDLGIQDLIYEGNAEAWIRLANSLRLRAALRIQSVAPDKSTEVINDVLQDGRWIGSLVESARYPHDNNFRNPFYELHNTAQGMYNPSSFLISEFESDNDPRISAYADYSPQSVIFGTFEYVGVPSFMVSSDIDPDVWSTFRTSYLGDYFLDVNLDETLVSAVEVQFLLAECALLGYATPSSAEVHLEAGVRFHMEELGVGPSDIDDYVTDELSGTASLEVIIGEKWKSLCYTNSIELFTEWRRTGFPALTDDNGQATDLSRIPNRLAYPMLEISLNTASVQAVGHGINDYSTPMWWQN